MRSLAVAMLAMAPMLVLGATVNQKVSDVETERMQAINLRTKNVTVSFYMVCTDVQCFTSGSNGQSVFDRETFRTALATAYNTILQNRVDSKVYVAGQFPSLVTTLQLPVVENSIVNVWHFDRVLESTDFDNTLSAGVNALAGMSGSATDPTYWNVFIRGTLYGIPEDIADKFDEVILELFNTPYNYATLRFDSLWISTQAVFIQDQLEPVVGLGHKSQRLAIPLFLGILSMLVVPVVVSYFLVSKAQTEIAEKERIMVKEKENTLLQRTIVDRDGQITNLQDREMELKEKTDLEHETARLRDEHELCDDEMDWKQ